MYWERRKATLKDVAAEAGVHVSTVSRALSPDKRDLVNRETRAHKIDPHVEQSWQAIAHTGLPEYPAG